MMRGWLKYWRVTLALLTVFFAGAVLGFIGGTAAAKRKFQQLAMPESWAGQMMRRMDHELNLSAEQRQQAAPLLRNAARDLYATRRQATLAGMQHVRGFYSSLEPILTPEQKKKLEQAKERMKQRFKEGGENRPPFSGAQGRPPFGFPPRPGGSKPSQDPGPPFAEPAPSKP